MGQNVRRKIPLDGIHRSLSSDVKMEIVRKALKTMTPNQQKIFRDYYVSGLGVNEIAARNGVAPSTVSRTLKRVDEKIINMLECVIVVRTGLD